MIVRFFNGLVYNDEVQFILWKNKLYFVNDALNYLSKGSHEHPDSVCAILSRICVSAWMFFMR